MTDTAPAASSGTLIDTRGPRFSAALTAVLLLITVVLGLTGLSAAQIGDSWLLSSATVAERAADPAFLLLALISLLFLWGAVAGVKNHPYSKIFTALVKPRLKKPAEFEEAAPPTFAQAVGFLVTATGVVLHLIGIPLALPIVAGVTFVVAFLNASIGFCLGCQIYLALSRIGVIRTQAG